jgi:IS30 family transposase
MCYAHLTQHQRYQIEAAIQAKEPVSCIARKLSVHRSTVYRELRRGRHRPQGYLAWYAQERAERRARRSAANHPTQPDSLWRLIRRLIRLEWSPEEVRGYLHRFERPLVSVPAIYAHLRRHRRRGGRLHEHLRYGRRYHRWGHHSSVGLPAHRPSIHSRPAQVQQRRVPGHWEGDTLTGGSRIHKLLALVERKSRFLRLRKPPSRALLSRSIAQATLGALRSLPTRSITFDNGSEFSHYALIEQRLGCKIYFADPHSPWQRGTCENTIGLIRQYVPKGSSGKHLSAAQIARIEHKLNHRPRKCLGFKTPAEVLLQAEPPVALRT